MRLQALRCIRHIEGEEGAIFRELEANRSENDDVYFRYFKDDITKHFVPFEENPGYMETQTTVYHKPKKEIRFN